MKLLSVLVVAALALVSSADRAVGAECSVDQAKSMTMLVATILADDECLKTTGDCPNAACLKTMEAIYAGLIDCTMDGKNPRSDFDALTTKCGSSSGSAPAATFTSSAAVAITSAAVAVAAVCL